MEETKNLRLQKPGYNDASDIKVINQNMDKIDENITTLNATKANTTEVNAQLATKAPVNSPAFTGTATLGGKEIPTVQSGTWTPTLLNVDGEAPVYTLSSFSSGFDITGRLIHIWANLRDIKITNIGTGWSALGGLPRIPVGISTCIAAHYNIFKTPHEDTIMGNTVGATMRLDFTQGILRPQTIASSFSLKWSTTTSGSLDFDMTYKF